MGDQANKSRPCYTCYDEGLLWDSPEPCPDCDMGREIKYENNKRELKIVEREGRRLRKAIKKYESEKS